MTGGYRFRYMIRWENIYSHETGYVARLATDHFENTFDMDHAMSFITRAQAENVIKTLKEIGEGANNQFYVIGIKVMQG